MRGGTYLVRDFCTVHHIPHDGYDDVDGHGDSVGHFDHPIRLSGFRHVMHEIRYESMSTKLAVSSCSTISCEVRKGAYTSSDQTERSTELDEPMGRPD